MKRNTNFPVIVCYPGSSTYYTFGSVAKAAEKLGISEDNIRKWSYGYRVKHGPFKGYYFERVRFPRVKDYAP